MNLFSHIRLLEWNMFALYSQKRTNITLPTIFEYYSARYFTEKYSRPYHVWGDIPPRQKTSNRFHVKDTGVDVSEDTFTHICQAKYYSNGNMINYGKLSSFLAMPLLVGRRDMRLTLFRTSHSILDKKIVKMVVRGDLEDITVDNDEFLSDVEEIVKTFQKKE